MSALLENVFSMIKHIWSDDRGHMESTSCALLCCKLNFSITGNDFYKNNEKVLKKFTLAKNTTGTINKII